MGKSGAHGGALVAVLTAGIVAGAAGMVTVTTPVQMVGGQASAAALPAGATAEAPSSSSGQPSAADPTTPAPTTTTVTPPPVTTTVTVPPPAAPTVPDPAEPSEPGESPEPSVPSEPTVPAGTSDDTLDQDVAAAVAVTEAYWDEVFTGWDATWIGPQVYNGDGFFDSATGSGPTCGDDGSDTAMNAFFCGSGVVGQGFVAWDRQLM